MERGQGTITRSTAVKTAALLVLLVCLLGAAGAKAVVVKLPDGHLIGIAPRAGIAPSALPGPRAPAAQPAVDNGDVDYNGGPVLHSSAPYLVFWDPSGSIPASTETLLARYFTDVAHDSGLATNDYGVTRQYSDQTGIANYAQTFSSAQEITDTDPYPATDTTNCPDVDVSYPTCITDAQLQGELTHLIGADHLPTDGATSSSELVADAPIYFIVTPADVNICATSSECATNFFCAYHNDYSEGGNYVLYAAIDLLSADSTDLKLSPKECQSDNNAAIQEPNSGVDPDGGDVAIKYMTHEDNETITDPLINAWFDPTSGNEIADNCNAYGTGVAPTKGDNPDAFEPTLGGSATPMAPSTTGTLFNQIDNGDDYYVQSLWSNGDVNCEMRPSIGTVTPSFTVPSGSPPIGTSVSFDPSASSSTAGYSSIAWSFGDGGTSFVSTATTASVAPAIVSHTYTTPGTYTVTLTLVDTHGNLASTSHTVTILGPTPAFTFSPATPPVGNVVAFNAGSADSEPGASIDSWVWSFGDGGTGSGEAPSHTYASLGIYTVQLTVTDTAGLSSTISKQIQVVGPPTAAFNTVTSPPLAGSPVSFDGTASSDPNSGGSVSSYSWSFGDGATGTGATASHTYASPGTYTVQLTVTDSFGLVSSTISKQVQVFVPPSAAFTLSPTSPVSGHPVAFKGTTSSDPNSGGSISSYSWSFGDDGTASGAAPSHTYKAKGTYTVKLTVTDNFGISTTVSHVIKVIAPGPPKPSHASLSGVGTGKPKLTFQLAAGKNAPSLKQVVIALPSGLSFRSKGLANGVSVRLPGGKKLRFTDRLRHGKLTITLRSAASDVQVTIGGAAIAVNGAVEHTVNQHRLRRLSVPVTAVNSSGTQTKLTLKLPV